MTAEEAIAYIEAYGWSKTKLGVERTRELLCKLGDPQKTLKFIHVAGSNGKGCVCAMLDAVLRRAGYRTGLFTSPYLQDFCERVRVDGEDILGEELAGVTERVRAVADAMDEHPSQFELLTAVAMQYFADRACDIVVLETGMGGELDATNVIDCPEVAVITNISLEHTQYLGGTLEEIARMKSGIIKEGCSAVCYDNAEEITSVVEEACRAKNVPLRLVDMEKLTLVNSGLSGQAFLWCGGEYRLALLGRHQLHNASTALEAIEALRARGWEIPIRAVQEGLAGAKWPARFEIVRRRPIVIVDGGHNPQCARALSENLGELLPGKRFVFMLGVLAEKDYPQMLELLMPLADEFICLTPPSKRALQAEELAAYLRARGARASACPDVTSGVYAAVEAAARDGVVVAFGSLYLAGAIRGELQTLL